MSKKAKYVWLNIQTGEFSNSWCDIKEDELMQYVKRYLDKKNISEWKLIRYNCLNDGDFEFSDRMKIK